MFLMESTDVLFISSNCSYIFCYTIDYHVHNEKCSIMIDIYIGWMAADITTPIG